MSFVKRTMTNFHESISAVCKARDKWLRRDGGVILPDVCNLYINGTNKGHYQRDGSEYWRRVYDFEMNPIRKAVLHQPSVSRISARSVNMHI